MPLHSASSCYYSLHTLYIYTTVSPSLPLHLPSSFVSVLKRSIQMSLHSPSFCYSLIFSYFFLQLCMLLCFSFTLTLHYFHILFFCYHLLYSFYSYAVMLFFLILPSLLQYFPVLSYTYNFSYFSFTDTIFSYSFLLCYNFFLFLPSMSCSFSIASMIHSYIFTITLFLSVPFFVFLSLHTLFHRCPSLRHKLKIMS